MQLIGMLDSPYVRRVAISLQLLGLPFEHRSLSVFRDFDAFSAINPVVKAPTLVCDDGEVLMDSTLILDHLEAVAGPGKTLMPTSIAARQHDLRVIGLALAACEKAVQIIYERNLRPAEKQHAPWIDRVGAQLRHACDALEAAIAERPLGDARATLTQAGVTTAVAWRFIEAILADRTGDPERPALREWSTRCEALPEFKAAPHGDSTYRASA